MDTWVEPYLKQRVPVDTGNMRRSFISDVTKDLHGNELYRWGFTAPYARIVAKRERYVDERAVILRAKRSLRRAVARVNAEGRR
ncbi:MAG: hypothetical protein OXG53_17970 [Chloroflexi bacterium]|nr:hypothetical protein [Chloroflexota bacterium]